MPRPWGKKPSQHHQTHRGTTLQQSSESTDKRQPEEPPFDTQQYTNAREPYDDTESVEEVMDDESIPDAFKTRKRARSSHI